MLVSNGRLESWILVMLHLLVMPRVGVAVVGWKKNIIGGKEVNKLRSQEVGRAVHMDVEVYKSLTEIGMKKRVKQVLKFSINER